MQLKSLELKTYRNYQDKHIIFQPNLNIIVGLNGQGKSNLIEAIQYLSQARSHKTSIHQEVIQYESADASLEGHIYDGDHDHVISIHFSKHGKLIKWNGKTLSKSSDILRVFHCILITSQDYQMLVQSPVDRRKYIDSLLSKLSPEYMIALKTLKKINRQKNNLYKQWKSDQHELLSLYQEELLKQNITIVEERKKLLKALETQMNKHIHKMFSNSEKFEIELRYIETLVPSHNMENLLKNEKKYHESLYGAHRDDFVVYMGGKELKKYMSHGEQQLIALLLKLGEKEFVIKAKGVQPVILIDDAWLGLDDQRKGLFKEILRGPQQKIITSTTRMSGVWDLTDQQHIIEL